MCCYVQVKTKGRLTQKVIEMESALAESKADSGTALNNVRTLHGCGMEICSTNLTLQYPTHATGCCVL